jgi:hypothetical protein
LVRGPTDTQRRNAAIVLLDTTVAARVAMATVTKALPDALVGLVGSYLLPSSAAVPELRKVCSGTTSVKRRLVDAFDAAERDEAVKRRKHGLRKTRSQWARVYE